MSYASIGQGYQLQPNQEGAVLFIGRQDAANVNLSADYTPFGQVTRGMDIVDQVALGGDDSAYANQAGGGHPKVTVTIRSLTVS